MLGSPIRPPAHTLGQCFISDNGHVGNAFCDGARQRNLEPELRHRGVLSVVVLSEVPLICPHFAPILPPFCP